MKKYFLFLVLFCFAMQNPLFAQNEVISNHIHVIIKNGQGVNNIGYISGPGENGKTRVTVTNIGVLLYFQEHAEIYCGPIELEVYNPQNGEEYATVRLDPTKTDNIPESIQPLCLEPSYYNPKISFSIYANCNSEGNFIISLAYRLKYNDTNECIQNLFPFNCYPQEPASESYDYNKAHAGYIFYVPTVIDCNPIAADVPSDPPYPGVGGEFEPRKAAPDQIANSDFQIAPNPFTTDIQVQWTASFANEVQFDLFDGNNRLVKSQRLSQVIGTNQHTFNTADFANGFYYLRIKSGEEVSVRRLVKIQ